ncbi:hypothetical protein [Butyrivibrio sp. NC3005]|uniref:hypothetical protein n=1 Tax=Butyrivibrio sp. NC3005 TaxID=1280685 RepID=UPI00042889C5|nr:hypothetical protein [Butyrivibrio sp. NC3005]
MKIKKIIVLCACVALTTFSSSYNVLAKEECGYEENCSDAIATKLGGKSISPEELPDGIIPLEFDSVEEAKKYLTQEEDLLQINAYNVENNKCLSRNKVTKASSNTGVKTSSIVTGLGSINVYAKYSFVKGKFTKVNSVTTSYTGLTIGNEWVQDTYSSSITKGGKKLSVSVYGHYDHYILVNTSLTKISSSKANYNVSWKY